MWGVRGHEGIYIYVHMYIEMKRVIEPALLLIGVENILNTSL